MMTEPPLFVPPTDGPILSVNLSALARNVDAVRARLGDGVEIAPVVKADAYGLGACAVTRHLVQACGIKTVFVAYGAEAAEISALPAAPQAIYVLNGPKGCAQETTVRPVLSSRDQADEWARRGGGPCALSIDIGMNRLGLTQAAALDLPPDDVRLVVMHLSHSGQATAPQNRSQIKRFVDIRGALIEKYPQAQFSLSASGGVMLEDVATQDLVRPGIILYGSSASSAPGTGLAPVATLTAPVLSVRTAEAGETVGYDGRYTVQTASRLAVIGIGYADGYPRSLTNKGTVWIGGAACPVVGAVSMDLLTVDITHAPKPVGEGDHAELFGPRMDINVLAAKAGTISYELLSGLGRRVRRIYTAP